jgi:hypothetical protein
VNQVKRQNNSVEQKMQMLDGFSDVTKDEKRYYVEFVCSETNVRPVHNISWMLNTTAEVEAAEEALVGVSENQI